MLLRPARFMLAVSLLAAAVCAVDADAQHAQQPPKAPATAAPAASGKEPAKTTPQAAPQQAAPAGGVVVFIDPDTGQIRQPDAAEIGTLSDPLIGTTAPANASGADSPAMLRRPVAKPPIMVHGPGNSVGVKLGDDSLSYMVVTKTPDGKLAEDCVTGDTAAGALVSKGVTPKTAAPKKAKEVLDDK
jgi:hypothetical protein